MTTTKKSRRRRKTLLKSYGGVHIHTGQEFLKRKFKTKPVVLAPWLPYKGTALVYGQAGCGKTHLILGCTLGIASGMSFLGWQVPKPRSILYIDGEMSGPQLKLWIKEQSDYLGLDKIPNRFRIISADSHPEGIPDVVDPKGQAIYEAFIADSDVVVFDNLFSLGGAAAEMFPPSLSKWFLKLRRQGKSIIVICHANKQLKLRGASAQEANADTVMRLRLPPGYSAADGCHFIGDFDRKHRGFYGRDAEPFEAIYKDGKWTSSTPMSGDDQLKAAILEALKDRTPKTTTELYAIVGRNKTLKNILQEMAQETPPKITSYTQTWSRGRATTYWRLV